MGVNTAGVDLYTVEAGKSAAAEALRRAADDAKPRNKRVLRYWREVERYRRATTTWHDEVKAIEDLYLEQERISNNSNRRFALLWSNVETMKPAVYARLPIIECTRRYKDRDPVARTAAELMERASNTTLELYGADEAFQMVRDDRLLGGRGQAWVRYEATIERFEDDGDDEADDEADDITDDVADADAPDPIGQDADDEESAPRMSERLAGERVCVDYVHTLDFGHNTAQTWNDVWLVWRCVYKTREEMTERFGAQVAATVRYDAKPPQTVQDRASGTYTGSEGEDEFCRVFEFWDRRARLVTWACEGMDDKTLDEGDPPISFSGFFPCPRPAYATKTSRSLIPRPDYVYYRDQAKEINDLTDKIGNMMQWLVVKAFTPAGPSRIADPLEEVIRDKSNRELIVQVEDWTQFTERGGVGKLIEWMPIDAIIQAIQAAISARNQLIQDVFQITGISDILRGQTDPNETLGAQELKAQTGSRRLRNTKDEIARFCRDTARLVAEVIAEKFEPESIAEITGFRYQPAPAMPAPAIVQAIAANGVQPITQAMPSILPAMAAQPPGEEGGWADEPSAVFGDEVVELLRNDRLRSFRIDVETDSTSQPNEAQDQQRRTEFLNASGAFLDRAAGMVQSAPDLAPVAGEMLMFGVRSFRAGRGLEETIERAFAKIAARAQKAAETPQPSPIQIKAQADAAETQQRMQQQAAEHAQAMEETRLKTQADLSMKGAQIRLLEQQMQQQAAEHAFRMDELTRKAQADALALASRSTSFNPTHGGA